MESPVMNHRKTCDGCRHWLRGVEQQHPLPAGYGACALTETADCKAMNPTTKAAATDACGTWAMLLTEHSFGCVQWATSTL
jgi:hypothetical protein